MRHLTAGIHFGKCVVRRFRLCAKVTECTYTNLDSIVHYTYLLTPWSRVLLEKLTGSAVSQEIPRIFETRKFITVLTSARHLSLSWANSIQYPQPPPTSRRSILILSSHLRLGLPSDSPLHTKAIWYSLLLLGYKPVQHVTVLNTVGNCNTMVSIIILY